MTHFDKPEPKLIVSGEGSIRITGRAGLDVVFRGRTHRVSSEMPNPPMTIALSEADTDVADPEERGVALGVREARSGMGGLHGRARRVSGQAGER